MKHRFLEVTFRHGKPLAAYYYLPRKVGDVATRSESHEDGLIVDFTVDGRPMGVEITAPRRFTLARLNRALAALQLEPAAADDVAPLLVAAAAADARKPG